MKKYVELTNNLVADIVMLAKLANYSDEELLKSHPSFQVDGIPDGWEFVGVRRPEDGEWYIVEGIIIKAMCDMQQPQVIVRRIAPEMGPLDAGDFERGDWLLCDGDDYTVVGVNKSSVDLFNDRSASMEEVELKSLRKNGYMISRDRGKTWHPCEKPVAKGQVQT